MKFVAKEFIIKLREKGLEGSYFQRWIILFSGYASLQHLMFPVDNIYKPSMAIIYCLHHMQPLCGCLLPSVALANPFVDFFYHLQLSLLYLVDFNFQAYLISIAIYW
jgi:hypothetical protein